MHGYMTKSQLKKHFVSPRNVSDSKSILTKTQGPSKLQHRHNQYLTPHTNLGPKTILYRLQTRVSVLRFFKATSAHAQSVLTTAITFLADM